MDLSIAALLTQDGITNGAIYALLALALVLVFTVTRVIWVPSGEFVAFGTLTLAGAAARQGRPARSACSSAWRSSRASWKSWHCLRARRGAAHAAAARALGRAFRSRSPRRRGGSAPLSLPLPGAGARHARRGHARSGRCSTGSPTSRWPRRRVLVLLIVSVARALRAGRARAVVLRRRGLAHAAVLVGDRSPWAASTSACRACSSSRTSVAADRSRCALFFGRTLYGKALRATALNRVGARLVGVSPELRRRAHVHARRAAVRVLRRADRADHDRLLRLRLPRQRSRASSARSSAGSSSYPLAAAGALLVGLIESFSSFWASAFKEVIVFTLIIPVLLWRSLTATHHDEDE